MTECLGDKLPQFWWRTRDLLLSEYEAHGTRVAAADAHGIGEQTLNDWWRKLGLPTLPKGTPLRVPNPRDVDSESVSGEDMLRQRVQELERLVSGGHKEDILRERMIAALKASLTQKTPSYSPAVIAKPRKADEHEMALLWSDTHAGEVVSLEETNGLNTYDWQTMMQRHDSLTRGILSYKENRPYPVRKLHVWALGDMLSGEIHEELAETNEFPIIECAVQFGLDAAEWLEGLIPHFEEIRVAGVVGNHPRLKRKQPSKHKYSNFDWLVYHTMQQRLRGYKQIRWEIPKAQKWPVEICGRRALLFHGDGVRSTMVDVPWGGIIRYVNKLANQYARAGKPVDHFVCGHYHDPAVVKNRRILMNGSVKGVDEYSVDAFGGGEPPCQLLTTFHPKRGMTDVSFIDLET